MRDNVLWMWDGEVLDTDDGIKIHTGKDFREFVECNRALPNANPQETGSDSWLETSTTVGIRHSTIRVFGIDW